MNSWSTFVKIKRTLFLSKFAFSQTSQNALIGNKALVPIFFEKQLNISPNFNLMRFSTFCESHFH